MFLAIYLIEFKRNLKGVSFYIYCALLFFGAYMFASNLNPDSYLMGLSIGKEWHNAPLLIAKLTARFSVIGVLFTMVMVVRLQMNPDKLYLNLRDTFSISKSF